jgi:hypothetical protein
MHHADSTARKTRPSKEAILRALEQLAQNEQTHPKGRASGFYVVVDEFAGLDRLDRAELDDDE